MTRDKAEVRPGPFAWLERFVKRLPVPTVWIFYLIIVLEFLYMFSPFYFYGLLVERPAFRLLASSPTTGWLVDFVFNPQAWFTVHLVGIVLFVLGVLIFALGYAQILRARLTKRGIVTGGFYRLARHPQYTGAILAGFGLFMNLPRFMVLVLLLLLVWVYYLLAKSEERHCLAEFGDLYRKYMTHTGLLTPKPIKIPHILSSDGFLGGRMGRVAGWIGAAVVVLGLGFAVRAVTDRIVPIHRFGDTAVVQLYPPFTYRHMAVFPILPMNRDQMEESIRAINEAGLLERGEGSTGSTEELIRFIAYAMPDYENRGVTIFDIGQASLEGGPVKGRADLMNPDLNVKMLLAVAVDHRKGALLSRRNHFEGAYLPMDPLPGGIPIDLRAGHVHPSDY
ncbi:methyltransferase family protein [candidate division KSB1 bacterium]